MQLSGKGRRCVFDLEGDNLYPQVTKVHCAVAIDVDTDEIFQWRPWEIEDAVRFLSECEELIGHNILDYDCRVLEKLFPDTFKRPAKVFDTLVAVRLVWPADTLWGPDLKLKDAGRMPPRYVKAHSLAAWGFRLGNYKGDYAGPWDVWSEEMQEYMVQDGRVNLDLYRRIRLRVGWDNPTPETYVWPELPFYIEHEAARIILQQTADGFAFNREAAIKLSARLQNRKVELDEKLVEVFGSWWANQGEHTASRTTNRKLPQHPDVTIPRFGKTGKPLAPYVGPPLEECTEGSTYTKIELVTFQPSSRDHLGQRLQAVYGWTPTKFGVNGKPTVDETTLSEISEKVLPPETRALLLEYFVTLKTLGQLSTGRKSWLACCAEDGRIHGRMHTCGAITGRGIHLDPNLGQVISVEVGPDKKPLLGYAGGYGWECRNLFTSTALSATMIPALPEITGTDASSLELICLGHYLAPLDDGAFIERVCDPNRDPHTEHGELCGLPRKPTKTVTYAYVYGASAPRVGEELEIADDEIVPLLNYKGLPMMLSNMRKRTEAMGQTWIEPDDLAKARIAKGRIVILAFEKGITGIKALKDGVSETAAARKWLRGLDGRKLYVRKAHAALNTLLQGAGAIICKLAMVLAHKRLVEKGFVSGVDFRQVAWVHDEWQVEHRAGLGPIIGETYREAIREAGEVLKMRGALRGESKTGRTWAETH